MQDVFAESRFPNLMPHIIADFALEHWAWYWLALIISEAKDSGVLGEKSVKGERGMYTIGA